MKLKGITDRLIMKALILHFLSQYIPYDTMCWRLIEKIIRINSKI